MTDARWTRLLLRLLLLALAAGLAGACAVTPIQLPCCEGGVLPGGDASDRVPDARGPDLPGAPPVNDLSAAIDASLSGEGSPQDGSSSSEKPKPPGNDLSVEPEAGQGSDGGGPKLDKTGKPTG